MPDTPLVSATSAAHDLGISRERVVRLVQKRLLDGRNVDGRWLVDRRSLEGFDPAAAMNGQVKVAAGSAQ